MAKYDKIIFVCTENTCRSIMAETIMAEINKDPDLKITSRGLVVLFSEPMNPKAVAVMKGNSLEVKRTKSMPLRASDVTPNTLILAMTRKEAETVRERFGTGKNIYSLGEFVGNAGNVGEPHGGTLIEYGACYEYIDLLVKMAAEKIYKLK